MFEDIIPCILNLVTVPYTALLSKLFLFLFWCFTSVQLFGLWQTCDLSIFDFIYSPAWSNALIYSCVVSPHFCDFGDFPLLSFAFFWANHSADLRPHDRFFAPISAQYSIIWSINIIASYSCLDHLWIRPGLFNPSCRPKFDVVMRYV